MFARNVATRKSPSPTECTAPTLPRIDRLYSRDLAIITATIPAMKSTLPTITHTSPLDQPGDEKGDTSAEEGEPPGQLQTTH
jgi:hypothetical protein